MRVLSSVGAGRWVGDGGPEVRTESHQGLWMGAMYYRLARALVSIARPMRAQVRACVLHDSVRTSSARAHVCTCVHT